MPPISKEVNILKYQGSNFLKQRLILSTLSGKPVYISNIRSLEIVVGLKEYEINLIRLLDKITNGTKIELNETGTAINYSPGILHGGSFNHQCCLQRGIGYYLDALLALGPFCKEPLDVTLYGVTNSNDNPSVDYIKNCAFPILKKFILVDDGLEMKVIKRGAMPLGGGEINFKCPIRRYLRPIQCLNPGMVKRFRGVVYGTKVSSAIVNRIVESAKGILLNFIPDVYIHTNQCRGKLSGNSPGFGLSLTGETTENFFYGAETACYKQEGKELIVPEDLGRKTAFKLLEEIYRGGCIDSSYQWLAMLYMGLGEKNVSKCLTGPLSNYSIHFLRHLRDFLSLTFKLENPDLENECDNKTGAQKVILTCIGIGYTNISKRVI